MMNLLFRKLRQMQNHPPSAWPLTNRLARVLLGMAMLMSVGINPSWAESMPSPEYQLKASYIYHFTKFIQWPQEKIETGGDTFSICVWGKDPFGKALDVISGKQAHGASIGVFRIREPEQRNCNIVFVNEKNQELEEKAIEALSEPGVLVIGESEAFIENGGILRFLTLDDRVRFQIDQEAAEAAGLDIAKKLMSVAVPL